MWCGSPESSMIRTQATYFSNRASPFRSWLIRNYYCGPIQSLIWNYVEPEADIIAIVRSVATYVS